jgi:hypothetical protein
MASGADMAASVLETARMVVEKCKADPDDMIFTNVSELIEGSVFNSLEQGLKMGLVKVDDSNIQTHLQAMNGTLKELGEFVDAWADLKAKNPETPIEELFTSDHEMNFGRLNMALFNTCQSLGQNIPCS